MFTDPFDKLSIFEKSATIALYVTLIFAVLAFVIGFCVKKFKPEKMRTYSRSALAATVGYAVGMGGLLLFLKLDEYITSGYIELATFVPIIVMILSALVLAIAYFCVSVFKKEKCFLTAKISVGILGAELLAVLIAQTVLYYQKNTEIQTSGEVQLYIYTAILIAALFLIAFLVGKKKVDIQRTRMISYAAICAALAFALSYIRFLELPQGGSITLASLLPLMLFSYMFGIRRGLLLGTIYGLLQFIQAPWFTHPVQFLLDYPIAFGAIGLSGLFKELKLFEDKKPLQFALGAIVAVIIRYLSHVVSGIFVFGSADPENYSAVAWSFLYNSFAFADMAISLLAGCALFASKSFVKMLDSVALENVDSKQE